MLQFFNLKSIDHRARVLGLTPKALAASVGVTYGMAFFWKNTFILFKAVQYVDYVC
jgi:hypothetical protein